MYKPQFKGHIQHSIIYLIHIVIVIITIPKFILPYVCLDICALRFKLCVTNKLAIIWRRWLTRMHDLSRTIFHSRLSESRHYFAVDFAARKQLPTPRARAQNEYTITHYINTYSLIQTRVSNNSLPRYTCVIFLLDLRSALRIRSNFTSQSRQFIFLLCEYASSVEQSAPCLKPVAPVAR